MCNIFESPMTLAVAKPPYHSPTCRPPPSRDTPHTHWTLLQRDLPIEHQRTYKPYSSHSAPHPYLLLSHTFSFLSGLDPPAPGPQSQRSASCPGRFPFAPYTQHLITPCSAKPGSYSLHNTACTTPCRSAADSSFLLVFYAICTRNSRQFRFCVCLCVRAIA